MRRADAIGRAMLSGPSAPRSMMPRLSLLDGSKGGAAPVTDPVESPFAIDALRRCALFAKVDDEALVTCARSLRVRRFRRGETIFHQGDPGDSLYIIEFGLGEDRPALAGGRGGGDHRDPDPGRLLRRAGPARRRAALGDRGRARARRDARPASRARSSELIDTDRELRMALFAGLAAELRRLTGHVEELHFLDLPGRLASRLVRLAREADAERRRRGPPRLAVHPVRARRDDRRHAPDREPPARGHGHRGPAPLREGHDRHPSLERLAHAAER